MPNLNYDGTQDVTQNGTLDVTQEDIYALILEMIKGTTNPGKTDVWKVWYQHSYCTQKD